MKRFLALALIGLAILGAAIYFADSNLRARAIADARRDLSTRAQLTADALDRILQLRMMGVFTFAALPSFRGFAASDEASRAQRAAIAQNEMRAIVAADPNVRAASIVDALGTVNLTTDGSMGATWLERAFVREALAGHLHASVPSRDFGEISQYYSAPILDNAGNVAGALVVRVAVQEWWNVISSQTDVLVVDENGVRIADRSGAPQVFVALMTLPGDIAVRALSEKRYGAEATEIRAINLAALSDEIKRGRDETFAYRDSNGQTVHAAAQRLATNPWTVIVFETEDVIAARARNALWEAIKLSLVMSIVTAGVIFFGPHLNRRPQGKIN